MLSVLRESERIPHGSASGPSLQLNSRESTLDSPLTCWLRRHHQGVAQFVGVSSDVGSPYRPARSVCLVDLAGSVCVCGGATAAECRQP